MTFKRNLFYIRRTIILFLLPVVLFLFILISNYLEHNQFLWINSAKQTFIFTLIISLITIPGFLLHLKYYYADKEKTLSFGENYLELINNNAVTRVNYEDLVKVESHYILYSKIPWNKYGYTKLFLLNGTSLFYNCLTHDHISSILFFKSKNVVVTKHEEIYPWQ